MIAERSGDGAAGPERSDDLAGRLAMLWRRVALRMADLPICNPAIEVSVTDVRRWGSFRIAVVTTPWFMNVVAVPDDGVPLPAPGSAVAVPLPDGELDAIVAELEGLGRHASASLFSPMDRFAGDEEARSVAAAALDKVMEVPEVAPAGVLAPEVDRRALLFGRRTEARP